jgi:hypothetical protein
MDRRETPSPRRVRVRPPPGPKLGSHGYCRGASEDRPAARGELEPTSPVRSASCRQSVRPYNCVARDPHFRLIDLPRACDRQLYSRTLEKVVTALSQHPFVHSIYQIGSVRHPGISDIDLLVIVDDAAQSRVSPLGTLTAEERYLFTHSCFLVPESLASELTAYSPLHGLHHLYGTTRSWDSEADSAITTAVRQQTAKEFLVKNLLDLYVQVEYGIVKVRVLLQHVKGLRLDLDLLQIPDGDLHALVERAIDVIDGWFQIRDVDVEPCVAELALELLPSLRRTVDAATQRAPLYAPSGCPLFIARNMVLDSGPAVELRRRGFGLPRIFRLEDRRHFNAHHRVNRFRIRVPVSTAPAGSYEAQRFHFFRHAKSFVSARFPAFSAPIPPLFYYTL